MSIKLKTVTANDMGDLEATYVVKHASSETHLELEMQIHVRRYDDKVTASMDVESPAFDTPDEAMDKLADWLERSAAGIRSRSKDGVTLQVGTR